jgi:hypothetical protein
MVDTVFSSDGICTDPPGFSRRGGGGDPRRRRVFIADEVQPGSAARRCNVGLPAPWQWSRHRDDGQAARRRPPARGLTVRPEVLAAFGASAATSTPSAQPVAMAAGMCG